MMPEQQIKPERNAIDPEKLETLLQMELIQKRAEWQQASSRRQSVRMLAYAFILLVVIAAVAGCFVFFSSVGDREAQIGRPPVSSDR